MKKIFILFLLLFSSLCFSQTTKVYKKVKKLKTEFESSCNVTVVYNLNASDFLLYFYGGKINEFYKIEKIKESNSSMFLCRNEEGDKVIIEHSNDFSFFKIYYSESDILEFHN